MKQKKKSDLLLDSVRKIHMIGIGGSGMYPIAEILHSEGYELTGSDNNETDTLARVRALGIRVTLGHKAENIEGAQLVIYSAAIMKDNAELVAAKEQDIPLMERSQALGALTRRYDNVVGVCGTHGKTTTSSMITQILVENGFDPSAVIGGRLPLINSNGRAGGSDIMVCESCEYVDTFLQLSPDICVLLNIDRDHMEYFKTTERLIQSFATFAQSAKTVIYNKDDLQAYKALDNVVDPISYGLSDGCDYQAKNIVYGKRTAGEYDLFCHGEKLCHIVLSVPGAHNISNSVAAAAAAHACGATPEQIAASLKSFSGAGRRFEILAKIGGITVADDYAHHPKELEVTLGEAVKMGYNRVIAVFQPFTFSRTSMLLDDFARVLSIPDITVLSEIMGSREVNTYGITTNDLCEKIDCAVWFDSFEKIAEHVVSIAKPDDLIITLGCGDIYKAAKIIIKLLNNN